MLETIQKRGGRDCDDNGIDNGANRTPVTHVKNGNGEQTVKFITADILFI